MKISKFNTGFNVLALGTIALGLSGCMEQGYGIKQSSVSAVTATIAATPTATPAGVTTQTAVTFRTMQPALAVRATGCLMCHAQMASNVITDFGLGDPFFFNKQRTISGFYGDWYDSDSIQHYGGWGTSIIQGSVYIPKTSLDHTYPIVANLDPQNKLSSMSLATIMQASRNAGDGSKLAPMTAGVSPPTGSAAVIEKAQVYIGAPTDAEMQAIAPTQTTTGFTSVSVNGVTPNAALPLSGLRVAQTSNGSYVTNSSSTPFVCTGDVMIKGVLFLNSPQIKTDNNGCRLYVLGSVFIQGAISYVNSGTTSANLQITSSRSINMGFSMATLNDRLCITGDRQNQMPGFQTRLGGAPATYNAAIATEASILPGLTDAGALTDASIVNPMNALLLNAPIVNSRYGGNFKGAVVAEVAIFRLSDFVFSFDPIFQKVPILPALKKDILSLTD